MDIVKLTPAYKSIIWGGDKLKREYGKVTELSPLASVITIPTGIILTRI